MENRLEKSETEEANGISEQASDLRTEQERLLYSNLPASIAINALLALILVSVQSTVIPPGRLLGWSALLGVVLLGRTALLIAWRRSNTANRTDARRWLPGFRIGAIATGIAWGAGGVLLSPSGDLPHQVYTSFVLAGLSAGAMTSLAIDRISIIGFLLPALLPHIAFFIAEGGTLPLGMSAMIALFLIFIAASARQSGIHLQENFRLRINAVESETHLREMLESSPIAARIADAAGKQVVFANASYLSLIGSTREQVIGIDPSRYYAHPEEYADVLEQLRVGTQVTNKLIKLHPPGENTWTKWALASYFQVEYRNKPAILGWYYDITDRKKMEEEIEHLAFHDPLTGLPNRSKFRVQLQQALSIAEREKSSLALLFIDLDRFKPVNDQYGHDIGDLLLKVVAERIRIQLRKSDSVARIGGDEFVVLLPSIKGEKDALRVAEKIRHALNQPFEITGFTLGISSSTGVAIYPDHAGEEQQLMKHADTAMYHAKAEGRNNVKTYRPEMQENQAMHLDKADA